MYNQDEVAAAFETLKTAMAADTPSESGSYAHSWHCNIAMTFYDEFQNKTTLSSEKLHELTNRAASHFMQRCFGVITSPS